MVAMRTWSRTRRTKRGRHRTAWSHDQSEKEATKQMRHKRETISRPFTIEHAQLATGVRARVSYLRSLGWGTRRRRAARRALGSAASRGRGGLLARRRRILIGSTGTVRVRQSSLSCLLFGAGHPLEQMHGHDDRVDAHTRRLNVDNRAHTRQTANKNEQRLQSPMRLTRSAGWSIAE